MTIVRVPAPDLGYLVKLGQAAVSGLGSARTNRKLALNMGSPVWVNCTIGGIIGASAASLRSRQRPVRSFAVGALVGGAAGLGCGLAWAARHAAATLAKSSIRSVNAVRDAHWLEKNPINYA
jgi:hypothetical protein